MLGTLKSIVLLLTDKVALIFPIAFSPTEHRFGKISILLDYNFYRYFLKF